jgi:hypothetical protein
VATDIVSGVMNSEEKFRLAEKVAQAIAEYEDADGTYPFHILRMPLAEYVVDEIETWVHPTATMAKAIS